MTNDSRRVTRRRLRVITVTAVAAALSVGIGLVGYRLGQSTLDVSPTQPIPASPVTVTASSGTLVDQRSVSLDAEWRTGAPVLTRLTGTITWAATAADSLFKINAGAVMYSVDEIRVVAMPGAVPAYREMGPGDSGADVIQLQQFLVSVGYPISGVDGTWRQSTTAAYKRWRADNLLPAESDVKLGEIQFLPGLPLSTATTESLVVGGLVADGDALFVTLDASPTLSLSLPADSQLQINPGSPLEADFSGAVVSAVTTDRQSRLDDGTLKIEVDLADIDSPCDSWCDFVPTVGVSSWTATITVNGPATGVIVPVGALRSDPNGHPAVITVSNGTRKVEIVLQVGAQAVVTGIDSGERLILPTADAS